MQWCAANLYLFDSLTCDVVPFLFANLVVDGRGAGRILLPGQEPEDANETKDVENRGPLQSRHHLRRQGQANDGA